MIFSLTHNDDRARDRLKSLGVQEPVLQYLLFNEIMNPGACDAAPYNDQVAFQPGDYCWIQSNHPEWFLNNPAGQPIGQINVSFDAGPGQPGLAKLLAAGGPDADPVTSGMAFSSTTWGPAFKMKEWGRSRQPTRATAGAQAAVEQALKSLYSGYFSPGGRRLYRIYRGKRPAGLAALFAVLWMGPCWKILPPDGRVKSARLSVAEWEQQMEMAASQAQAMGKTVILVAQGEQADYQRETFALASYLLVADGRAFFPLYQPQPI